MISRETSEKLRALAFSLALLVVPIHCGSLKGVEAIPGWIRALQAIGSDTISRLAVPFFFVVSGFFLMKGIESGKVLEWWKRVCGKRMMTLVIPYLMWNVVYYGFKFATGKYGFEWSHASDQLIGWNLVNVPACGQFWYIRCILLYVLAAPVLWLLLRNLWLGLALLALDVAAWFAGWGLPFYVQPLDGSYLLYFCGGMWLGLHLDRVRPWIGWCGDRLRGLFLALFVVSSCGVVWAEVMRNGDIASMCNKLMILSGLATVWFYADCTRKVFEPLRCFWELSFFIYAFHVLLVSVTYKITSRMMPEQVYQSVGYLMKIAVGMFGSVVVGALLRQKLPRVYSLLCGGR